MYPEGGAFVKWRVWMACGLLLLAVCIGTITQIWIEDLCDELCYILREEPQSQGLPQAKQQWEKHIIVLSVLIRHDRVDQVSEAFARAEAFLQMGTEDECRAETAEVISKLTWLREYDRPGFRSIF